MYNISLCESLDTHASYMYMYMNMYMYIHIVKECTLQRYMYMYIQDTTHEGQVS